MSEPLLYYLTCRFTVTEDSFMQGSLEVRCMKWSSKGEVRKRCHASRSFRAYEGLMRKTIGLAKT